MCPVTCNITVKPVVPRAYLRAKNARQKIYAGLNGRLGSRARTLSAWLKEQAWDIVDKLILEKIPIAGISRVTEISEPWLQQYINQKYEHVPQQIGISKKGVLNGRVR